MAEIIRTQSVTETTTTSRLTGSKATRKTTERVIVHGIRCDRVDVSVLRDLVHALEMAGAPAKAQVTAHNSDIGHLTQLTVKWNVDQSEADEDAAERRGDIPLAKPAPADKPWLEMGDGPMTVLPPAYGGQRLVSTNMIPPPRRTPPEPPPPNGERP